MICWGIGLGKKAGAQYRAFTGWAFCYARRWQIEAAIRYSKSELAMESPRLWFWENRLKLMMILSVVYAFLLSLLLLDQSHINELLRWSCHKNRKAAPGRPSAAL